MLQAKSALVNPVFLLDFRPGNTGKIAMEVMKMEWEIEKRISSIRDLLNQIAAIATSNSTPELQKRVRELEDENGSLRIKLCPDCDDRGEYYASDGVCYRCYHTGLEVNDNGNHV